VSLAAARRRFGLRAATLLAGLAGWPWWVAAADALPGVYSGRIDGKPATLTLQEFATNLTGRLNVEGGYAVLLNGRIADGGALGGASGPAGAATFELTPNAGGVTLILEEVAPVSGRVSRARFEFTRTPAEVSPGGIDTGALASQRDARVVGAWLGSRLHHAGDMILRMRFSLEFAPDGSYTESADFGADGSMSPVRRGMWSTAAGVLRVRVSDDQWESLGRYQARGSELVLIGADGAAEVWRRAPR
jgi:hypothetical protein